MSRAHRQHLSADDIPSLFPAQNLALAVPEAAESTRPPAVKYVSAPAYQSPLRHHRRAASTTREVKETLNARSEYSNSEDDGTAQHRINQYIIKQEIGRGSFGAVHLAVDQYGEEYAVKEFSKSRLRKRAQSNLLRGPTARRRQNQLSAGRGFNSPLHRHSTSEPNNSLELIREEVAVMKKLNHPNLVSLIEVLDDPEEDSLYMVLELCKKGVVMKVGLEERADPYDEEQCRCWFRDMILGIEYLHAQGIIHRDIKPDNCLVTDDDVLKIVDFGVSEMFEKDSEMKTKKSAGSPAFMPPELCVPKHGDVSGKAADIWSMGVTLHCLRLGRIPFEKTGMLELYESIRNDELELGNSGEDFKDLMYKLLEKDPEKRITMDDLREHAWVTRRGTDRLLPKEENIATIIEPPTDEEVNAAITGNMGRLLVVMKAVKRFKQLLFRRRPDLMQGIFGQASRMVQPPLSMRPYTTHPRTHSLATEERKPMERVLTTEGVHWDIDAAKKLANMGEQLDNLSVSPQESKAGESATQSPKIEPTTSGQQATADQPSFRQETGKGHAHNPLEDTLFLDIECAGPDEEILSPDHQHIICESPSAVDINVYETAYQEEIEKILKEQGKRQPTLYLTRRVEGNRSIREHPSIFNALQSGTDAPKQAMTGFARLVQRAKDHAQSTGEGKEAE